MVLSRRIDDKEIQLKNQSLIYFQISGAGHEAMLVAAGMQLQPGHDWFYPYYRDRALCLDRRRDAARDAAGSGGRRRTIPRRADGRCRRTGATSSSTSSRSRARPARSACRRSAAPKQRCSTSSSPPSRAASRASTATKSPTSRSARGRRARANSGSRSTPPASASLPLVYLVEDNGYAISVPVEVQTAGGDISQAGRRRSPTCSSRASTAPTSSRASARWRKRSPTRARARARRSFTRKVIRPYSHSLSDDEQLYKTPVERAEEATRDPIVKLARTAEGRAPRDRRGARRDSPRSRSRSERRRRSRGAGAEADAGHRRALRLLARRRSDVRRRSRLRRRRRASPDTMVAAINRTLKDEMARDPRIVVFGEDVADCSREEALTTVLGQGRRVQGHARPAARVRRRSRVQLAARRSQHHRARHGHGDARPQAGRRDSVLRLHLAGDDADSRRADDAAVSLEQRVLVPDGHSRADRRLPARRRAVSQPVGREHLRALPGHPHRRFRRTRRTPPACCARRSAATIRCSSSSTSTSTARPTTRASIRGRTTWSRSASPRSAAKASDVVVITWGALVQRSLLAAQQAEKDGISVDGDRPADDHAVRLATRSPRPSPRPTASSSRTKIS